ncbi:MAG: hypothetical protein ABIC04_02285 [Nanoarchaeota archaeon]
MHKLFEFGDIGFGIISGILLAADSLKIIDLDYFDELIIVCLALFALFSLLNMVLNFKHLKVHVTKLAVLHGIIDFLLSLSLIAFFLDYSLGFLDPVFQYYANTHVLAGIGIFFAVTNLIWVFIE